jgi:hypothetical protein
VARLTLLAGERLAVLKLSPDGLSAPFSWSLAGHGTPTALLQTGATSVIVAFTSDRGDLRINDAAAVAQFQVP